jgi:hypothetical protein
MVRRSGSGGQGREEEQEWCWRRCEPESWDRTRGLIRPSQRGNLVRRPSNPGLRDSQGKRAACRRRVRPHGQVCPPHRFRLLCASILPPGPPHSRYSWSKSISVRPSGVWRKCRGKERSRRVSWEEKSGMGGGAGDLFLTLFSIFVTNNSPFRRFFIAGGRPADADKWRTKAAQVRRKATRVRQGFFEPRGACFELNFSGVALHALGELLYATGINYGIAEGWRQGEIWIPMAYAVGQLIVPPWRAS